MRFHLELDNFNQESLSTLLPITVCRANNKTDRVEKPPITKDLSAGFCCRWKDQNWSESGVTVYRRSLTTISTWPESRWENSLVQAML